MRAYMFKLLMVFAMMGKFVFGENSTINQQELESNY